MKEYLHGRQNGQTSKDSSEQLDLTNRVSDNFFRKKDVSLKPNYRKPYLQKSSSLVSRLQCNVGKMNFSSNFSMVAEESKSNSNDMKDMRGKMSKEHSLVVTTVCGSIAIFSIIGNLLLCIVILKRRSMLTKPYNVLIFNLAATDMLTGEICFIIFLENFA